MTSNFIRARSRTNSSSSDTFDSSSSESSDSFTNAFLPYFLQRNSNSESEDNDDQNNKKSLDLSFAQLTTIQLNKNFLETKIIKSNVVTINLSANDLTDLPSSISLFVNLTSLDISQNSLTKIDESILKLNKLSSLIVTNNHLNENSFPKNFSNAFGNTLKVLSLGGNEFTSIPDQIFELNELRSLYLGSNQLQILPKKIRNLEKLQNLYLGGNLLVEIPFEVGFLQNLQSLSLCENKLKELPSSIAYLRNLKSLALHRNELTALPPEIVKLRSLYELSLRDNPLVVRFVRDMVNNPPSLLELAGRCIKINKTNYEQDVLPKNLVKYLTTAQRCVNSKCKGVYFDTRVEHIKFVDFCGIYRLPLLQYLCSPCCTSYNPSILTSSSEDELEVPESRLRKVLLGSN